MKSSTALRQPLRALLCAGLLLACAAPAQAYRGWELELLLGLPWLQLQVGVPLPAGAVSVQVGGVLYGHHRGQWYRPWGTRWILVAPPLVLSGPVPGGGSPAEASSQRLPPGAAPDALPTPPPAVEPRVEPLHGQTAVQLETDRRDCERGATTDPAAMADAGVFHRSVLACLRARGYGVN